MVSFQTKIEKFGKLGEKTGWSYVLIPKDLANQIKPDTKKSFRVKGKLDAIEINSVALIPMGEGDFIIPLKADLRKKLRKEAGASLYLELQEDTTEFKLDADFEECLALDENARSYFESLAPGHQRYFSNWISEAKTNSTKEKRIVETLRALQLRWDFGQMIRARKGS